MANLFDQFDNPGPATAPAAAAPSPEDISALAASRPQEYQPSPTEAAAMASDLASIAAKKAPTAAGANPFDQFDQPGPAPTPPQSPDAWRTINGVVEAAARGATGGLIDKGAAAADAGIAKLTGDDRPFSDIYQEGLQGYRKRGDEFAASDPIIAPAAYGTGAVGSAIATAPAAAATMLGKIAQGAGLGAAYGGASGLASTNDKSVAEDVQKTLEGAGVGATVGAILPPAVGLVTPAAQALARKVLPGATANQAAARIASTIGQDAKVGGPGIPAIASDLADANGAPLAIADVGGENAAALGGQALRVPGPGRQQGVAFLKGRDEGAGTRLGQVIDSVASGGKSAYSAVKDLSQERATAAAPLYEQARQIQGVWSPRLQQFLDDPVMKAGLNKGMELERIEAVTQGRPFDPTSFGADLDAEGNVALRGTPNMSVLDAGKKGLDAIIADERNAVTGKLSQRGRAINEFRAQYLKELDNLDPTAVRNASGEVTEPGIYAQARNAYSGPSRSMDAVNAGSKVLTKEPERIADELEALSPGDRQFYRLGAAQALRNQVESTGQAGNEARSILKNKAVRDRIDATFGENGMADKLIAAAEKENRMFATKFRAIGGSESGARIAQDTSGHGGVMEPLVQAGVSASEGAHLSTAMNLMRALGRATSGNTKMSPDVAEQVSKMLYSADPAEQNVALARIIAASRRSRGLPIATLPAASLGGRALPDFARQQYANALTGP